MHKQTLLTFIFLCFASVIAATPKAQAFSIEDYANHIKQIVHTIESACNAYAIGPANAPQGGRKECGEVMRGHGFVGFKGESVFYTRNKLDNGFVDVLGIERQITGDDGELYSLIRSLNTTITRPHEQPEETASYADATLFVKRQNSWKPVWRFVNPHTNDWLKANPMFLEQQGLTPKVARMIDRLWHEVILKGTAKLAFTLRDATGPVFTARNPKVRE